MREFTGGLNTTRMPETTSGGVLIEATDGHITRGGEFEKRAAFVPTYTLPDGTVGLAYGTSSVYVFGHLATPVGLPAGVTYQQLVHPVTPATALVGVPSFDLFAGKIYAVALFADGQIFHFYDGVNVAAWFDGRARATLQVTSGTGASTIQIAVNSVNIMAAAVTWTTSNVNTASLIAAAINSHTSSPDYIATAIADTVVIAAALQDNAYNGFPVTYTLVSGFTVSPASGLTMQGGIDPTTTFSPGTYVRTIGSKMYAVSGPNLHFSGIKAPTKWTTATTGAGFIDMSSQASGSEELKAVAKYQNLVAVFAENTIQIEYVDPDPSLNKLAQVLENTGTPSPRSVTQFGDSDLFYLNESGLRSLRARDASNAAATTDIGVPVDTLITDHLQTLTDEERAKVFGAIELQAGRFWLSMKDRIFVFSYFSGAKVSAWSVYLPAYFDEDGVKATFDIEEQIVFKRRVYLRSGNTIYVYGGLSGATIYDETQAIARLPYLDGDAPAKMKNFSGYDAAVQGSWETYAALDPVNINSMDPLGTVFRTTFPDNRLPMQGASTHISMLFKSTGTGPAKIGSAAIHYTADGEEDGTR